VPHHPSAEELKRREKVVETTETKAPLTEENVKKSLKQVDDPELGINIVDLGLVYETRIVDDKEVQIVMTLTTPFCPIGPSVKQQITQILKRDLEGVEKVDVQFTFNPPWDKDMMSEDAKDELGIF
jgi:metal-sulfur cluster biosynthetic enzyme